MSKIAAIIGRVFLALLFIFSGAGKLMDVGGTEEVIASAGLPNGFAIIAGVCELIAGFCLAAGFMVRLVALLLVVFLALTIFFFHNQIDTSAQAVAALRNLAIIGGLLLAFAHSQMWGHYYAIRKERRGEVAAREAEERLHEAELRAARAEAAAEAAQRGPHRGETVYTETDRVDVPERRQRRRWFDW